MLLARGANEIERLFPGFLAEMVQQGAQVLDAARDVAWLTPGGWGVRFDSGFELCCATRDLIEAHVRRRTLALPNVTLQDGISVATWSGTSWWMQPAADRTSRSG